MGPYGTSSPRKTPQGILRSEGLYEAYLNRWIQPDTIIPNPANPQSLNRYSYVYNNPLLYNDPSGHIPWLDWVVGAAYQFTNNMLFGAPHVVWDEAFGPFWEEEASYSFQQGQQAGQIASQVVGTALTVDGITKAAIGLAAGPPTVAVSAAAAVPSGGISVVGGGLALTAEGVLVVTGVAEAGYGASVLYISARNQPRQPRYTQSNFRRNLENRTPIPRGMQDPEAHHMLPKELADQFDELFGINVHDPRWGAWAEGGWHQSVHAQGYNPEWARWLDANRGATLADIVAQAQYMAQKYGFNWSWQP
jgi:hypothetical protein